MTLVDKEFLNDEESRVTIISWNSWKLHRVTRSSSGAASKVQEEAEYTRWQ